MGGGEGAAPQRAAPRGWELGGGRAGAPRPRVSGAPRAGFRGGEVENPTLASAVRVCRAAVVQVRRGFGKLRGIPGVLPGRGSLVEGLSLGGFEGWCLRNRR